MGWKQQKKAVSGTFSTLNLKCLQLHDDSAHFSTNIYVFLSFLQSHSTYSTQNTQQAVLKMLRENKDRFDLVLRDVHMPDMDGYKLLELVGLEMDLPVMSKQTNLLFYVIRECYDYSFLECIWEQEACHLTYLHCFGIICSNA